MYRILMWIVSPEATNVDAPLVVTLLSNDTTEIQVPASVTIQAGSSSAPFQFTVVDDDWKDGTQIVTISATATDYTMGVDRIAVVDDE